MPRTRTPSGAPRTHQPPLEGTWLRPYSKEEAIGPLHALRADKYWSPVGRIDNVTGDRHPICTCPPMESYGEAAQ